MLLPHCVEDKTLIRESTLVCLSPSAHYAAVAFLEIAAYITVNPFVPRLNFRTQEC